MKSSFSVPFRPIAELAKSAGLELIGVCSAVPKPIESARLKIWQESGHAADMSYMQRNPELQSDPLRLLPQAKSIISVAFSYDSSPAPELKSGYGRVARYAWGKDYHLILPQRLMNLVALIREEFGDFKFRVFSDAVPLLERAFAASSGLGFIGKNTLLIRPKLGSFTLIAEILCDFEITGYVKEGVNGNCGKCSRCIESCPTGAFESEYVLNARKCISYLSIKKKGILSIEERGMLGDWIFGCDICQEVCPFNHAAQKGPRAPDLEEFLPKSGVGPQIRLVDILEIKDQREFRNKFQDSPLLRPKRSGLIRNAICVAVNTGCLEVIQYLKTLAIEDSEPLVRQFAFWGAAQLSVISSGGLKTKDKIFLERGLADPALQVTQEVRSILDSWVIGPD